MEKLISAYLNTNYSVRLPDGWHHIRIGQTPASLPLILQHKHWVIVTAHNPISLRLPTTHNFIRHQRFTQLLRQRKHTCFLSLAKSAPGLPYWPSEPGWLIVTPYWDTLFQLARDLNQLAIVTHHSHCAPCLCMMQPVDLITISHLKHINIA